MSRGTEWNECSAFARSLDEAGRERTVCCDLPLHSDPQDAAAEHWDAQLEIYWHYADGSGYNDEQHD